MRTLVVGLGTQGMKRRKFIETNLAGTVDPANKNATYFEISEAPLDLYDVVFLCVPDEAKQKLIEYCILNRKHVLVEKPLALNEPELQMIEEFYASNLTAEMNIGLLQSKRGGVANSAVRRG
jgi:N-acetyl-gamma-glutamylphosphate reductase